MTVEVGNPVNFTRADGKVFPALVLHVYPHDPASGVADAGFVNLVYVTDDASNASALGRGTSIAKSVPREGIAPDAGAENEAPARPGTWREAN